MTSEETTSAWPDEIELTLDGIAQGGEGVGRWGERVLFVRGGLPGERVRVTLRERRENYARGDMAALLEAAPERVEPRDPQADHMAWQHIAYPAQLRYKRQILTEQLAKIAGLPDAPVEETQPAAQEWAYRTSARLHSDGRQVGYHAAGTNELRPITHDPLLYPVLDEALSALRAALADEPEERELEVLLRASETHGYALGALSGPGDLRLHAARWRGRCPALAGVVIGPRPAALLGAGQVVEELGGVTFALRPATFFQVSLSAAESLLALVRAGLALQGGERVLDLYCGAGAFALPLAAQASEVLGIEAVEQSAEDALTSAALNKIANVEIWVGPVERALTEIESAVDAVVLDPPRRGCHPAALAQLLRLRPRRIVYVSCQPATLARDIKILGQGGYALTRVTPVDLFPQTPHIESVSVLELG